MVAIAASGRRIRDDEPLELLRENPDPNEDEILPPSGKHLPRHRLSVVVDGVKRAARPVSFDAEVVPMPRQNCRQHPTVGNLYASVEDPVLHRRGRTSTTWTRPGMCMALSCASAPACAHREHRRVGRPRAGPGVAAASPPVRTGGQDHLRCPARPYREAQVRTYPCPRSPTKRRASATVRIVEGGGGGGGVGGGVRQPLHRPRTLRADDVGMSRWRDATFEQALGSGPPEVFESLDSNCLFEMDIIYGDVDAAFARADSFDSRHSPSTGWLNPMEGRGGVATSIARYCTSVYHTGNQSLAYREGLSRPRPSAFR